MGLVQPARAPYATELLRGSISGRQGIVMHGVDAAAINVVRDIWSGAAVDTVRNLFTTDEVVDVVSSSAADAAAGTGARTVRITGVNLAGVELTEVITLNGVTPVASVNSYLALNEAKVISAGSGGVAAGNITIDQTTSSGLQAYILAGGTRSQQSHFTIPAGFSGLILGARFHLDGNNGNGEIVSHDPATAVVDSLLTFEAGDAETRPMLPTAGLAENTLPAGSTVYARSLMGSAVAAVAEFSYLLELVSTG